MKGFLKFLLIICSLVLSMGIFCSCNKLTTKESFTVTFCSDGGTLISGKETQSVKSSGAIKVPKYAKTGYEFDGWDVEISDITESTTVTAQWKLRSYTILYKLNGGTVDGENPTTYNIESSSITLINPEKEGANFLGWKGINDTSPVQSVTIPAGSFGNKEYEAVWQGKSYNLSFNANGGLGEMQTISVRYEETINLPQATFTKTDYIFDGWAESADGEVVYADIGQYVGCIGDKELFAKYKGKPSSYTVEHYIENDSNGYDLYTTESLFGNAFTSISATPKTLDHYCVDISLGIPSGTISPDNTLKLSLYYRKETIITFDANGGTGKMLNLVLTSKSTSRALYQNTFVKESYDFMGWATSQNGIVKYADCADYNGTDDVTLYAVWSNGYVNVSFDLCGGNIGGETTLESETVLYGGNIDSLPSPEKEGYSFIGWFNGKEKVDITTTFNFGESITLSALFEKDFIITIILSCDVVGRTIAGGPLVKETVVCAYDGSTDTITKTVGYGETLDIDFSKLKILNEFSQDYSLKGLYSYSTGTAIKITADTVFDSDTFKEYRELELKVSCKTNYTPNYD